MTATSSPAAPAASPLRVAVAGASGRMGRMLIEAIRASDDCVLAGALDVAASPAVGSYGKHKDQLVSLLKQAFEI